MLFRSQITGCFHLAQDEEQEWRMITAREDEGEDKGRHHDILINVQSYFDIRTLFVEFLLRERYTHASADD